jgi:hypothetical protein
MEARFKTRCTIVAILILLHKEKCHVLAGLVWVGKVRMNSLYLPLKGQCHEIFDFWFFSQISFPQAPEYTIRSVSNFFENYLRYLQLKEHH